MYLLDAGGPIILLILAVPFILAGLVLAGVIVLAITMVKRYKRKQEMESQKSE